MDFSSVKEIEIPEGDVTKITSGTTVLWEKTSEDWGTLYYNNGTAKTLQMRNAADVAALCNGRPAAEAITFSDGTRVTKSTITGFEFGENVPTSIGNSFLYNCYSVTRPMTVPSGITSIGEHFLWGCKDFVGPLTVNTTASPTDQYTLSSFYSTDAIYATGVTITGSGASAWKTALPDSASSPYRKLILSS